MFEIVLNLSLIHNTAGAVYIDSSLEEIFSFRFFSFYFTRHICLLETWQSWNKHETWTIIQDQVRGYKTYFILNSTEHEMVSPH